MSESRASDERLRSVFAIATERAPGAEGCPADEEIWAASRDELAPARTSELLLHSATCGACAESFRMAAAIAAEAFPAAGEAGEQAARAGRWSVRGARWRLGLLAAAAASVVLLLWTIPLGPPTDSLREAGGISIESRLAPGKPLAKDHCVLRWSAGTEGTLYTLEVAREDLAVLVRADAVEEPEYIVPAAALEALPSGATLFWRVEALLPDGTRLHSRVFRATVE